MGDVADPSLQGFPPFLQDLLIPGQSLALLRLRELRGDSGLPTVKLCELRLGRRRLFGAVGMEMRLLALT